MKSETKPSSDYINNIVNFRRNVFNKIAKRNPNRICFKSCLKDVRRLVIINAAPRSGSSLLFAILKKVPQFYSLSGESVPFYKLNGFAGDTFACDEIPSQFENSSAGITDLSRDFLSDFSIASSQNDIFGDDILLDQYFDDLALRFPLQWPQVNFSYDVFRGLASQAFALHRKTSQNFSKEEFYLQLLWFLRQGYPAINPYYYDIPVEMIARKFPSLEVPLGPPNNRLVIEEPPFILLSPDKKADKIDLIDKTLLLKSSVDSYRMCFIENLFSGAEIKIIYLTRNPAASINGLCDGWLHRGFFSHNLEFILNKKNNEAGPKMLNISGYSDMHEWGKWWWNYDLPCGWQDYAQRSLEEVCAFQWHSANRAIREYLNKSQKEYCLVKYENIVSNLEARTREIGRIMNFIGVENGVIKQLGLNNLPIVQVTQPFRFYKWKKRENTLLPILSTPEIIEMSALLGYNTDSNGWF